MRRITARPVGARIAEVVLTVGVAFALSSCAEGSAPTGEAAGSPPPTSSAASDAAPVPAPSSSTPETPILAGKRQVVIRPVQTVESILHVDDRGHLALTDGESTTSLFVLVPDAGDKVLIRLAGQDQSCIGLTENPAGSATLDAAPCDAAAAGQQFVLEESGPKNQDGDPTYAIRTDKDRYIRANDETGVEAVADPGTTFSLVDNGAAPAGPGD